ncbi:hypothetical protein RUND412_011157 [Rhizina undulata]
MSKIWLMVHSPGSIDEPSIPGENLNGFLTLNNTRFEKVKEIGRGRIGSVWLIENKSKGKLVCKEILISPDVEDCERQLKSFEQACSLLQRCNHPNIVRLEDYKPPNSKDDNGRVYMEYCAEGDLLSLVRKMKTSKYRPLTKETTWKIVFQLAAALAYLHHGLGIDTSRNCFRVANQWTSILHRNVKLKNDCNGSYVGTAEYKAPEITGDSAPWTPKADIYSLGHKSSTRRLKTGTIEESNEDSGFQSVQKLAEDCTRKSPSDRPSSLELLEIAGSCPPNNDLTGWDNCRFTAVIGIGSIEATAVEHQNEPLERLKLLVEDGVDINGITNGPDEDKPLHEAARTGNYILAERLLALGVDVDAVNGKMQTALPLAKNQELEQLLLEKQAVS